VSKSTTEQPLPADVARERAFVKSATEAARTAALITENEGHTVGMQDAHADPADRLIARLAQAGAMIRVALADEVFPRMNDSIQINFLTAIADLIDSARCDADIALGTGVQP